MLPSLLGSPAGSALVRRCLAMTCSHTCNIATTTRPLTQRSDLPSGMLSATAPTPVALPAWASSSPQPCSTPCSTSQPASHLHHYHHHLAHIRTHTSSPPSTASSLDSKEAAKFAALSASWWDPAGPFAPLHRLNPARCKFIRQAVCAAPGGWGAMNRDLPEPLKGLRALDVGCGGGILAESLARLGATVHAIDVTEENVLAASRHSSLDPQLSQRIRCDRDSFSALSRELPGLEMGHGGTLSSFSFSPLCVQTGFHLACDNPQLRVRLGRGAAGERRAVRPGPGFRGESSWGRRGGIACREMDMKGDEMQKRGAQWRDRKR
jgi:hypothetical protein